jgi:hypothetical protein
VASDPTWQYFVALESDFARCTRYVELVEANFCTYSVEFAKILLAAGSEADVACRALCGSRAKKRDNIDQYRPVLLDQFSGLPTVAVVVPRYQMRRTPWASWADAVNPEWWGAYNQVKHFRHESYPQANLRNALDALAGLLVLTLYLHRLRRPAEDLVPSTQLLDAERYNFNWLGIAENHRLPGADPVPPAVGPDPHRRYL